MSTTDIPTELPNPVGPSVTPKGGSGWLVLGLALLALGAIIAIGLGPKWTQKTQREAAAAEVGKPRGVVYAVARRSPNESQLVLPGTALAIETAIIYARTTGFVREFKVDLGDRVKAGEVLAVLDTPEIESDAQSARARASESALNEKLAHAASERYRHLAEAGVNSREQADQAEATANSAQAALAASRAELARTSTMLDFRIVRAPFDGIITKRNIEKGSLVTAGSSSGVASLFELARIETLKIWVDVPQSLAQNIGVGDTVRVLSDSLVVPGTVARTSGALDPVTRTMRVEIHIPGDKGIIAGSFVRVSLDLATKTPPVLVPASCLSPRPEGLFVFTADAQGAAKLVPVVLGRELGVEVELLGGLTGGEKVIKNPPENLKDGEHVTLVASPAPTLTPSAPAAAAAGASRAPR